MAVNGYSADDLTEIALRTALFGEQNPLGTMAFLAEATNPLPALNGLGLSEDAFGQVARLLMIEELVGRLQGGHLTQFDISPARGRTRRIRLGWIPDRIYENVTPQPRVIEGEVHVV
jgi:hypothetical protein